MKKKDIQALLQNFTSLVVLIISLGMIEQSIRLVFIFIYMLILYFVLSNSLRGNPKFRKFIIILACCIEGLIVLISTVNVGSIRGYFINIKNAFALTQNSTDKILNTSKVNFASYIDKQVYEIINNFKGSDNNIKISDDNTEFSHYSKDEINEIIGLIEKYSKENADTFSDFKSDEYLIELFYKMFLSDTIYYYSNYIKAFEEYGINIDKLDLNEQTLITWDLQILFATYNMRCDNILDLNTDVFLDEIMFNYNDYKVSMQKYGDTFDYGIWSQIYQETTAKEVDNDMNDLIMEYYKKFMMNFKSE